MVWLPECIGIPLVSRAITSARLAELAAQAGSDQRPDGGRMFTWFDDASGACMVFNTDDHGVVACAQPAFNSGFDFNGRAVTWGQDLDGCRYCHPLVAIELGTVSERPGNYVFHISNAGLVRDDVKEGTPLDLIVTGFAENIQTWESADAFRREHGHDAHISMTAAHFDPAHPSPSQYLITGEVFNAERRRNSFTNIEFWALSVTAPFGTQGAWMVVARDEDLPWGVTTSAIVSANVWACAAAMS